MADAGRIALARAKNRAARRGIEFNLDEGNILARIQAGLCEATGVSLASTAGARGPFTPSLDRTDSSRGYTMDNVRVVCLVYNLAKSEFAHADVVTMARALVDAEVIGTLH